MKLLCSLFFACAFFLFQPLFAQAPKTIPAFTFDEVYQSGKFHSDKLPKTGYIVLDFYDPGCGHCQKMGAGIAQNLQKLKNVSFYFISMNDKPYVDGFINMHAKALKGAANVKFCSTPVHSLLKNLAPVIILHCMFMMLRRKP
ncbi:thioredoxin family protein [Sphingobacterium sp. E70]|uniref:TlpA family protein disulfide reductase n=1 Tax=Sphingobacterium sp. E70 TaxID=2853439 RepID=UPI00211CD1BE|nr:thioredoxin family protein [Sphingobacterium sp. E70]ULT24600.1 thioredoxin family protein [Sphingobacterium sp. E70]